MLVLRDHRHQRAGNPVETTEPDCACGVQRISPSDHLTHQGTEDEEDHEESAEHSFAVDVSEPDSRHGDEHEVDAFPVSERLVVGEVEKRVPRILHLK